MRIVLQEKGQILEEKSLNRLSEEEKLQVALDFRRKRKPEQTVSIVPSRGCNTDWVPTLHHTLVYRYLNRIWGEGL